MYAYAMLDHVALKQARLRTNIMTAAIFVGMLFILWFCADIVVGEDALLVVAAGATLMFLMSATPTAGLVMRLARAVPISPQEAPDLYSNLAELSRRAGLSACPRLWWLGTSGINAFAAGHGDGAGIAVSDGAFRTLSRQELVGVLAHEVAHIAAGDTRLITVGIVVLRVTQVFAMALLAEDDTLRQRLGIKADLEVKPDFDIERLIRFSIKKRRSADPTLEADVEAGIEFHLMVAKMLENETEHGNPMRPWRR